MSDMTCSYCNGAISCSNCDTDERKIEWISVEERLPEKKVLATYVNCLGNHRIIVASYFKRWEVESSGEADCYDEYSEELDNYFYREGWYEQQDNWDDYASIFVSEVTVTHWMPLPEPPNQPNT